MSHVPCDNIDRLISTEMRPEGLPRGITSELYRAARDALGGEPLTYLAATNLIDMIDGTQPVVISTGFRHAKYAPYGETDGLPGAIALARAVSFAFGVPIFLLIEEELMESAEAVARAGGLNTERGSTVVQPLTDISVLSFTTDPEEAEERAESLLDELDPVAIITTERIAPNQEGIYHSALETNISAEQAKVDRIVDIGNARDVFTLGIGDIGNEIGFGVIEDTARSIVNSGSGCACGCDSGFVAATETDVLVPAGVSNWGCYGIAAALAILQEDRSLLHTPDLEERLIKRCLDTGAIDGGSGRPTLGVDGIDLRGQRALLDLLYKIVDIELKPRVERGF